MSESYNVWRLVDRVEHAHPFDEDNSIHIVSDIDKTYLETEFDSMIDLARIAFLEDAKDKITVEGADVLLSLLRWDAEKPRKLHFVSSSPTQLREVLEEKLSLDGLDWSSDTFKNQAYNIRKRRFDLLRYQVAYKLASILKLMERADPGASFYFFGDNGESDPFIYSLLKNLTDSSSGLREFENALNKLEMTPETTLALLKVAGAVPTMSVRRIFIRTVTPAKKEDTANIVFFDSYYDVALHLVNDGLLSEAALGFLDRHYEQRFFYPKDFLDERKRSILAKYAIK